MIRIIEKPHLPNGSVRHILLGAKYKEKLEKPLFDHGLIPMWLPDNKYVDDRLSGHADLSAVHIKNKEIVITAGDTFVNSLTRIGFNISKYEFAQGRAYPSDAALNICIAGEYCICNTKTASRHLIKTIPYEIIECTQGYTKCSVAVVDENTIITSDKIIADRTKNAGFDVLLLDDSFVKLEGFNKGFIGGSAFKISKKEIAFTGQIRDTIQKEAIEVFLNKHNVNAVYLTEEQIFDIGSAIPLTEEF